MRPRLRLEEKLKTTAMTNDAIGDFTTGTSDGDGLLSGDLVSIVISESTRVACRQKTLR